MHPILKKILKAITTPIHTRSETYYFLENLSILLSSGTDISTALTIIRDAVGSTSMKQLIATMMESIDNGSSLWRAIAGTKLLPDRMVTLIKIGEEAGRLPENLSLLVTQAQKEQLFHSRIRSAMMYPVLVLLITTTVGIGISWFILPKLSVLFTQLKIPLPWTTRLLLFVGTALDHHGAIISLTATALIGGIFYIVFVDNRTKVAGQWLLLHLPGIKQLALEIEVARFGYIFGTLLSAGLPLVDALRLLRDATPFRAYSRFYHHLSTTIEDGKTMSDAFLSYTGGKSLIPHPIQQMMIAAWNSGCVPDTALNIGRIYEEKIDVTTKNISTLIEPIMLIIVWLGVVTVALAVISPIYQLIGNLNNGTAVAPVKKSTPKSQVTTATSTVPAAVVRYVRITATSPLNVREKPSSGAKVLQKIAPQTIISLIEEKDGWYHITIPNARDGWIIKQYATEIGAP